MSQIEELDKEIEEMEAVLAGKTTPGVDEGAPGTQTNEALPNEDVTAVADPQKVRNNWKKKYTDLRSHHDGLAFELRSELANVKEQKLAMQEEVNKLKVEADTMKKEGDNPYNLSQEESDILGVDAIAAIDKMNRQATEPLKEELDRERALRLKAEQKEIENMRASNQQSFLGKLGELVPDYVAINTDPKFLEYMDGVDIYSGQIRKNLFKIAERSGDVGRVAGFFKEFTKVTTPVDPLAQHVTPTGDAGGGAVTTQKADTITWAEVEKFYAAASSGEYKNNMAAFRKEESRIDSLMAAGRVI